MTCPHGHRVIDSSIPDPAGPLCWTVVELEPGVYRYVTETCAQIPTPAPPGDTREAV